MSVRYHGLLCCHYNRNLGFQALTCNRYDIVCFRSRKCKMLRTTDFIWSPRLPKTKRKSLRSPGLNNALCQWCACVLSERSQKISATVVSIRSLRCINALTKNYPTAWNCCTNSRYKGWDVVSVSSPRPLRFFLAIILIEATLIWNTVSNVFISLEFFKRGKKFRRLFLSHHPC